MWDSSGEEHYIDFTNWQSATATGVTYTPVSGYLKYNNGNSSTPFVNDDNLYKGPDGKYYTYSGSSYTLVTDRNCYIKESVNSYPTSGTGFNG